jgi:catechol 2,3-dioxygenase-like lactoylglutathione lyase family enzyme
MIKGLHHAGLVVQDLEAAIRFYGTAGGFICVWRFRVEDGGKARQALGIDNAGAEVAFLRGPTGFLELFQFDVTVKQPLPSRVHEAGIRHICLQSIDGNSLFDTCVGAGATYHARPSGLGTGNLYAYIRDPEGNILEVEGLPWAEGVVSPPWFAHIALVSADIARLSAFYEAVLGNKVHARGHFGPEAKFDVVAGQSGIVFDGAWLKTGHLQLEFWSYHTPKTAALAPRQANQTGWSHFAFEVDDIAGEYARLNDLGMVFLSQPVSNGPLTFVYGRDPDGNLVELLQLHVDTDTLSIDNLTGKNLQAELDQLHAAWVHTSQLQKANP